MDKWFPFRWERYTSSQSLPYPNQEALKDVVHALEQYPPLVSVKSIMRLSDRLSAVSRGEAFLLQGGDCEENLLSPPSSIASTLTLLMEATPLFSKPLVTSIRGAGQFAKPRSVLMEAVEGVSIPTYRGGAIHGLEATAESRTPDPERMLACYAHARQTLISINESGVYTAHEALLLPYEAALVRTDGQQFYDTSAHFLWLGYRTALLPSPHVDFLQGIQNPMGIKCAANLDANTLLTLLDMLNPEKHHGRIVLIIRLGDVLRRRLPLLIEVVKHSGHPVVWCSDPMHANTVMVDDIKTRYIPTIKQEITAFFDVCQDYGVVAGGVHLELTGDDVFECAIDFAHNPIKDNRYRTLCDPRLNREQALDVLHHVATRVF